MPKKGLKKVYFPKVKEARQVLADRAKEILEDYLKVIKEARADGKHEVAAESLRWLMEHMVKDNDGTSLLEPSIDKLAPAEKGNRPPVIKIGIAVGANPDNKNKLSPSIIDITPNE